MISTLSSIAPPHPPWQDLRPVTGAGGYLTFYYSDDMSRLPVRWVTKPGDNKSDPNLETLTYGLFSTCGPRMRSGIVSRRCSHLFFTTSRKGERVLTGYYCLRWYAVGALGGRDFCIAAKMARFVGEPMTLAAVEELCGVHVNRRFRAALFLTHDQCERLARVIDVQPDATQAYLDEIDRLERFNQRYGGYRYIGWRQSEGFSWDYAARARYLPELLPTGIPLSLERAVSNNCVSGLWLCCGCGDTIENQSLLKRCPNCGSLGSLRPEG
jgi:hypothetical protein